MSTTSEASQGNSPADSVLDHGGKEGTLSPADLAIEMTNAMNARDFDSPIWNNLTPTLRSTPQSLSGRMKSLPGQRGFVDSMRETARNFPEWNVKILTLSTHYDNEQKYAEVFVSCDVSGQPVGITRTAMTRMEFRAVEGRWRFVNHELVSGMDMAQGG